MAAGRGRALSDPRPRAHPRGRSRPRTDFTVGLEEEFAIVDPASLELVHRFEELYGACLEDELLAESAAGELIDTEIEIRSGRARELRRGGRAPARAPRPPVRARRAARDRARGDRAPIRGRATSTSGSSTPSTTTGCARSCAGSRSATTPGACTSTSASAAPTARSPSATTCAALLPPLLALSANSPFLDGHDTGLPRCAPRSSPAPSRAAASTSRSATGRTYADFIDLLTAHRRRSSSRPSSGGACARTTPSAPSRCGSATRRRAATSRSASRR